MPWLISLAQSENLAQSRRIFYVKTSPNMATTSVFVRQTSRQQAANNAVHWRRYDNRRLLASGSSISRGRSTRVSRKCPVSANPAFRSSAVTSRCRPCPKESRQGEQPVLVGRARFRRHGPPGFRRHIDEVGGLAGGGAGGEIEAVAQLLEQRQLPAHDERGPHGPVARGSPARTASPRTGWGADRARAAGVRAPPSTSWRRARPHPPSPAQRSSCAAPG